MQRPSNTTILDVVVPVFNEERRLTPCIETLHAFLQRQFPPGSWRIIIAENGSTDRTPRVADALTARYPGVCVLRRPQPGRGAALTHAWQQSEAALIAYMDVDLSTDLDALPRLVARLQNGCDVAVGSRLIPGAVIIRSPMREIVSRIYNRMVRGLFRVPLTDAQCGFKAMRRAAIAPLLPHIRASRWFFDTELLLLAHRRGLRVQEVPVRWVEHPDSRVNLSSTILQMAWGLLRLRCRVGTNGSRP